VERGRDPAEFILMAFGGAGPVHAAGVARELGIRRVLIPPAPGVFSAFGLLRAQIEQHAARTVLTPTSRADIRAIGMVFAAMRAELVERLGREGYVEANIALKYFVDLRYHGQSSEITVPLANTLDSNELRAAEERFEQEFERTYGHRGHSKNFELVTCRIVASVERGSEHSEAWAPSQMGGSLPERRVHFGSAKGALATPVVVRTALSGQPRSGPLVVQEYDTSVIVPPDCSATLDGRGNIVMEIALA